MTTLRFTKHAKERMEERDISEDTVRQAIERSDKIGRSVINHARLIVKKVYFNETLAQKHLLMVIYEEREDEILIITIIDTSKIDKYF